MKSLGLAQTFCLFTPVAFLLRGLDPRVSVPPEETVLVLDGRWNCGGANRGAVRSAVTCGAMSRIAILDLIEYEYRDAEYEKKHGASIGPMCSIERFMLFVYRRIRPWYKSFVVSLHWPS